MIITGIILFLVLIGTLNIIDSFESDEEFDRSIIDELKDDVYKVLACSNNENHDKVRKELLWVFQNNFSRISKIRNKNTKKKLYKLYDEIKVLSIEEIKNNIGGIKNGSSN